MRLRFRVHTWITHVTEESIPRGGTGARLVSRGSQGDNQEMSARSVSVILFAVSLTLSVCESVADVPSTGEIEFFEKSVRPILVEHCYECHSSREVSGGLRLDDREAVRRGGDSGPAIRPGNSERSLLIEAVRYGNRDLQMPPKNSLTDEQIATLETWVSMGAPDPRAPGEEIGLRPTGMTVEEGRTFWAFRPVAAPRIPNVASGAAVKNPIDSFVLSRLEEQQLTPAAAADRRTLIRRVTFDLTGLPPTPREVGDFLNDDSDDAWSKVIERLLNSPHYGIRWGRHWLDVARYADSNGLDENLAFGTAWRYRDYVVDAFNNDKPFDRFLVEQLAGDLLPDAGRETKTATAFLCLGAKVLAEKDEEKLVMDTVDEQLDATGKVFMGMTLGCVRCHDHKFDPLKQTDYYGLAAIFKSTRTFADTKTGAIHHWFEHSFATDSELEMLKEVNAEIAKLKKAATSFKNSAVARLRAEARRRAADYLATAAQIHLDTPLSRVAGLAEQKGLHARILHHCRLHLEYHRDDPLFRTWHELADSKDASAIRSYYESIFAEAERAMADAKTKDKSAKSTGDARLDHAYAALQDPSGFLAVPAKPEHAFDAETLAEYHRLMDKAREFESTAADETASMGVSDGTVLARLPIHIRGSHLNLGADIDRAFPAVLHSESATIKLPTDQSGRLEFAQWLTRPEHPLTARVYVNRVWNWHFGRGIVPTTENFGVRGERPSHPKLLDWLSHWFVQNGWSTKDLHRLILMSNTYRMAAEHKASELASSVDPENSLLWKFRMRRLESEEVRDAILAVSGRLDASMGGKTVPLRNRQFVFNHTSVDHTRYDSLRRSIYLPVIRNNLYAFFEQFDFPDPTLPSGRRSATVVAPQALLLMNSPLVMESAKALAKRLLAERDSDSERVDLAYELCYGRLPTTLQRDRFLDFVKAGSNSRDDTATLWSLACQGLLAGNEFIYVR